MRIWKLVVPAFVLTVGLVFSGTASFGKPEYSKKEKKPCLACHTAMGKKELNKVGECYKTAKSLANCPAK
jgi:hypothetical protein